MAQVILTDVYANLFDWPGDLLAASDGVTITTQSATNFTYTYLAGTKFAGFSVSSTGLGLNYDGATPIGGTMSGLEIRNASGQTVLSITNIDPNSIASDFSLFATYEFGWTDPGGVTGAQVNNAWSLLLSGDDTYTGTAGDDRNGLVGVDAGNDVFNMGTGDDKVNGGLGNDTINGGDGRDTLSYDQTHWSDGIPMVRGITVNVATGTVLDPYGFTDRFTGIENIFGSATRDKFIGGASEMFFAGLRGNDLIIGGTGDSYAIYYQDVWLGGARGIVAKLQTSTSGSDILGTIRDGFGNVDRTVNIFHVTGTLFNDVFTGSTQDDYFSGGEGRDSFNGGDGFDTLGFDWTFGDAPQRGISVNLSRLTGQIIDDGFGNTENAISIESIEGSELGDRIIGSTRDEVFRGRGGDDTLTGGGGTDEFQWRGLSQIGANDRITDFEAGGGPGHDILNLGTTTWGGTTTLNLVNGTASIAAVETLLFDTSNKTLYWDADGTGAAAAIAIVRLTGVTALTADNFHLV